MNLTQTASLTRRSITISILVLILGTIGFIGYKIWYANYLAHLPPVEEKPDLKFGQLPAPAFAKSNVSSSNFSYSIDTVTGGLPKVGVDSGFDKLIKVYFVTKTFASLLSPQRAQELADKFSIKSAPQILSETKYVFSSKDKNLTIDLDSGNFIYQKIATPSAQQTLDPDTKLISDFGAMLDNLGLSKPDLSGNHSKAILLSDGSGQISLWPNSLDNKPIVTPEFNKSLINAQVIQSAGNLENYLSLNFTYYPIDTSTFATYPIKTTDQALADLKAGKGVIEIDPGNPKVSITSVYLAYFLGENYSPYLLPVFVFEGPQFAAYVPAVTDQYQTQPI